MKIKAIIFFIFTCISCSTLYCQEILNDSIVVANEDSCKVETIQSAIDACLLLAESVKSGDIEAIRKAKESLQACGLSDFYQVRQKNGSQDVSLNGHLVFNEAFADSLVQGKNAFDNADEINNVNKTKGSRGKTQTGKVFAKTFFVRANDTSVYTFTSSDRQELSVVAEPGGFITTRIHAVNKQKKINEWHNDTLDLAKGRSSRKAAFTLPKDPKSLITLEIINCTNRDITIVVISN